MDSSQESLWSWLKVFFHKLIKLFLHPQFSWTARAARHSLVALWYFLIVMLCRTSSAWQHLPLRCPPAGSGIVHMPSTSNLVTTSLHNSLGIGSVEHGQFGFHVPCHPRTVVKSLLEIGVDNYPLSSARYSHQIFSIHLGLAGLSVILLLGQKLLDLEWTIHP